MTSSTQEILQRIEDHKRGLAQAMGELVRQRAEHEAALTTIDHLLQTSVKKHRSTGIGKAVIEYLTTNPGRSVDEIAGALPFPRYNLRKNIDAMRAGGKVVREGDRYSVAPPTTPSIQDPLALPRTNDVFQAVAGVIAKTPWLTPREVADALPNMRALSVQDSVRNQAANGRLIRITTPGVLTKRYALPGTPSPQQNAAE